MTILGSSQGRERARGIIIATVVACMVGAPAAAAAPPATGSVSASVTSSDGVPMTAAVVALRSDASAFAARTDARGRVEFPRVAPGEYIVSVTAVGFAALAGRVVEVRPGSGTVVAFELTRSPSSLNVLGRVTTHAGEALSTSTVPIQELTATEYAARGGTSVAAMIDEQAISVSVIRPAGGNPAAPAVVALRGSDPTETLVDVDGHSVNSGGTGAFDLSLIDPVELAGVQLVYGIAPSSLVGPNTIDGAINVRTLEPTPVSHSLLRMSAGSFGAFGATLQTTGTRGDAGYAVSLHRTTAQGEVYGQSILTSQGDTAVVGGAVNGSTALLKLRFGLGKPDAYVGLTLRDQSEFRDLSAALTTFVPSGPGAGSYRSFAGSSLQAHSSAYGLDLQTSLGPPAADGLHRTTVLFRHLTALGDQSVFGPAAATTPYLFSTGDVIADDTVQLDRSMPAGALSIKFDQRSERLATQLSSGGPTDQSVGRKAAGIAQLTPSADAVAGVSALRALAQTQTSLVVRYAFDPTAKLHYSAAAYYSRFSSFGASVDPRIGIVWTPDAQTAWRASVGSTFQSPQLPELYVPTTLPPPDSNGFVNVGNPHLDADHATDYDFGVVHVFSGAQTSRIDVDLYRTDLRSPAVRYFPPTRCLPPLHPPPAACESFPINAGGAVYRGLEIRAERALSAATTVNAGYSVNSSYATSVSPALQNGSIVPGEQFQRVPLHKAVLTLRRSASRAAALELGAVYEDAYNELNRPSFVTVNAGVTWHAGGLDVGVYGTNLSNVYADRFTLAGQGVPYGGADGLLPSDAYSLQGRALTLTVTRRY